MKSRVLALLLLAAPGGEALAADWIEGPPPPAGRGIRAPLVPGGAPCLPVPAPAPRTRTNGPEDPSYVGSAYGLSKPSYYGFTPPLGLDDPYGRRPRACP